MSIAEAASALHDPHAGPNSEIPKQCDVLGSNRIPEHVSFIIKNDTIVGAAVDNATVRMANGAGIGDSEDLIKALFNARLQIRPHPRFPRGHLLAIASAVKRDADCEIVFETDGDIVLWFRVGFRNGIDTNWGCPAA
jgi:hypothetical protein